MNYQQLLSLKKSSLIEIGFEMIKENLHLNQTHEKIFDKICVFANSHEIRVEFMNPIKYIPKCTEFYYDVTVHLMNNSFSYSIYSNEFENTSGLDTPFFLPNEESEKAIQFIIDAINKSENRKEQESRTDFLKDFDGDLIIRDQDDCYDITRTSMWQESWYKINKATGEIFDGGHAHLEPYPQEDQDKFVEIIE